MKKIILTILAAVSLLEVKAQTVTITTKDSDKVFTSVETTPKFPGGFEQFYHYLSTNIHYPNQSYKNNEQGLVVVIMVVEKDGSLSNIKVVRKVSPLLDQEAIRVMGICPKWIPAMQNGQTVRVKYAVAIAFKHDTTDYRSNLRVQ
jgi:periplasmic protein TonB